MSKKNKFGIIIVVGIMVFTFIFITNMPRASAVEKDINNLIEDYNERLANPSKEDFMLLASSNPYDYVKDNKYYNQMVNRGVSSLSELQKLSESKDSFTQYIIAMAIEEIINVDLKQYGFSSKFFWDTGKQFISSLSEYKQYVPEEVESIIDSKISTEEKEKELIKLGVLAVPYIQEKTSKNNEEFSEEFLGFVNSYNKKDVDSIKRFINE
jgi:hypothetical protein